MIEIFGVLLLAVLVEGIIEYFVSNPDKTQPWLRYVSAVLGIIACLAYKVDLLAILGLVSPFPFVGSVATGLIIGRGSNYVSDFVTLINNYKKS